MDMQKDDLKIFRFQRSFSLKINALSDCLTDKAFVIFL